jgi:hypothetical protein
VSSEADLREQFAALRQADELRAPDFARVLQRRARPYRRNFTPIAAAACLLIAAAVVIMLWRTRPAALRPPESAAPALADWRSPTDFLLDTPAAELLHAVPRIGQPQSEPPYPSHDSHPMPQPLRAQQEPKS